MNLVKRLRIVGLIVGLSIAACSSNDRQNSSGQRSSEQSNSGQNNSGQSDSGQNLPQQLAVSHTSSNGVHFVRAHDPLLGEVVWQDSRPNGLTWGDDLIRSTESGYFYLEQMSWANAANYCLNLNPVEQRERIRNLLSQSVYGSIQVRPDQGYFLPRIEDWRELAQAMGSSRLRDDRSGIYEDYSPANWFFRHLLNSPSYSSGYWAANRATDDESAYPTVKFFNARDGRAFDQTNTFIEGQGIFVTKSVRCVRAGHPW